MIRVKICGITSQKDAIMAVDLGADALGFIFAPSPRRITPQEAYDITRKLPAFVNTVGVFVDETPAVMREIIHFCGLDLIQLHGDESPELCGDFMPRTIKVFRIKNKKSLSTFPLYQGRIRAVLLDTYSRNRGGGTGKPFDWDLAETVKRTGIPVILSGGLNPQNIEEAVSRVRPFAVDINSSIEERPGKKDPLLMREVMEKINRRRYSW